MSEQKTILIVDDDSGIVRIIKRSLEQARYAVVTAYDGEAAIDLIHKALPDLLVLDINLPKKSGISVYHAIANSYDGSPKIPVIIMTGRGELESVFEGFHVDAFIRKPFDIKEFVEKVNEVIAQHYGKSISESPSEEQADESFKLSKEVLVVDDEKETADIVYQGLDRAGHEVEWVKSIEDLFYFAQKKHPDVIFIKLPDVDCMGPELIEAIKLKKHPQAASVPIHFYVRHKPNMDVSQCETVCATNNIQKTIIYTDMKGLVDELRSVVHKL